jgi:hypothetical protein
VKKSEINQVELIQNEDEHTKNNNEDDKTTTKTTKQQYVKIIYFAVSFGDIFLFVLNKGVFPF